MKTWLKCFALLASSSIGLQAWAQSAYPPAEPGNRETPNSGAFTSMEGYVTSVVLGDHLGVDDDKVAARIVDGFAVDFGDNAANFDFQQELVRLSLRASLVAPDELMAQINSTLAPTLLDYWNGNQVVTTGAANDTARAIHFIDLAQAMIRTGTPGDAAVAAAVADIWKTYGPHHPMAKDPSISTYLSRAVTKSEYVAFLQATLAKLADADQSGSVQFDSYEVEPGRVLLVQSTETIFNVSEVELGGSVAAAAVTSSSGCISDCINSSGCSNYKYWIARFSCRQACAAACAAAAIIDHLDEFHGLDL